MHSDSVADESSHQNLLDNNDLDDINDPLAPKQSKKYCCRKCLWFTCGFFLIILSIQLIFVPNMIDNIIKTNITNAFVFTHPEPDNSHYKSWVTNSNPGSVPISFSIQFFNVTNPDDVLINGSVPQLVLTPPIVYDQYFFRKEYVLTMGNIC